MFEVDPIALLADTAILKDKIVLITGGASGFGKRAALYAAQHGANVVVVDLNEKAITQTLKELRALDGECTTPPNSTDVTKPEAVKAAFDWCITTYGRPADIVIVSAGVALDDYYELDREVAATSSKPAHPREPRNITYAVNWEGLLLTSQAAQDSWTSHPLTSSTNSGRKLILLASMGGIGGIPGAGIYSMSKHATMGYWEGICKQLKREGQKAGYQCYTVCPFFADTPILPPATLAILAGLPLVSVDRVAQAMIYASTRPPSSGSGYAIMLPDDHSPLVADVEEYKPVDPEWSRQLQSRVLREDAWKQNAGYSFIVKDVAKNLFKTTPLGLLNRAIFVVVVVIGGAVVANSFVTRLPVGVAALIGVALGYVVRRAQTPKRARK